MFRPESLDTWKPETETDVYVAFGVLHEFTDFKYCCGASKAILEKLGADYDGTAKPDAILIDRVTDEYLMAEWKNGLPTSRPITSPRTLTSSCAGLTMRQTTALSLLSSYRFAMSPEDLLRHDCRSLRSSRPQMRRPCSRALR